MAIAVAASWTQNSAASNTQNLTVSGIQTGDLVVVATVAFGGSSDPVVNAPTDDQGNVYTVRTSSPHSTPNHETVISLADTKVAGAGPTTITVNSTSGLDILGIILRVTGHDQSNYADQFNNAVLAATTNPPIPTTTSVGGTRLVVQVEAASEGQGANANQPPVGYAMEKRSTGVQTAALCVKVAPAALEAGATWALPGEEPAATVCQVAAGTYRQGGTDSDPPYPLLGRGASW